MNYSELKVVIQHLQDLVGQPFSGVWQPERERLVLGIGAKDFLLIVPIGPFSRVHTILKRPKNPSKPYSFQSACRAYLRGRLTGFVLHDHDREFVLSFEKSTLIVRMTGRSGGIWLKHEDTIIASLLGPTPEKLSDLPKRKVIDSEPRFVPGENESWDRAASRWYTEREKEKRRSQRTIQLRKTLERAQKRTN